MKSADEASRFVEECQGLVKSIALKIHRRLPRQVNLDDLISDGQVALAQAARDFDETRGAKFSTFAYYRIRGGIYDGLSRANWWKRRSADVQFDEMAGRAVQESSGQPQDDVGWLSSVTSSVAAVFMLSQVGSEGRSALNEIADDHIAPPSAHVADSEVHEILHELVGQLPDEMAKLIQGVYFDGKTLHDVGVELKISKGWASRLHARALQQLAHSLRSVGANP